MSTELPPAPADTVPPAPATPVEGSAKPGEKPRGGVIGKNVPHRKWQVPQAKPMSTKMIVTLVSSATILVATMAYFALQMTIPSPEAEVPRLDMEFTDPINSYSIRPPLGWHLEDPHDKSNIYIKGPREPGFSPLIISSLDVAPGGIASYLQMHKGRIALQEKTVAWISEDVGESIDGCPHTARLEYEYTDEIEKVGTVKVRALQYIMEDKPRFYRVSCYVAADQFEKYLPKFEASVRSFRRVPLPRVNAGGVR